MRLRNLDSNWDWTFGQSQINYVKDENSILLDVQMRLKEWFQDCFFALQKGIAWSLRLGFHNQQNLLDADVKNVILNTPGILNLADFKSIVRDRRYRATMTIFDQFSTGGKSFVFETEI